MKIYGLMAVFFAAVLTGCGGGDSDYPSVQIKRLDLALRDGSVPADSMMRVGAERLFVISGYGSLDSCSLAVYAAMPSVTSHYVAVDSAFADMATEEARIGRVLGRLSNLLPSVAVSEVFGIVSPFNQSVFTVDSTLYIGLNHYLGVSYPPYGYFPDYVRRRKVRDRLPVDVAEALVRGNYPYESEPRLLPRMLYEGAVAEAVIRIAECDEPTALGYTSAEDGWLRSNEDDIWKTVVERRMLFSSDPSLVRSIVYPGPVTTAIHPDAPGGVGRFVGHRIVRSYLESHPDTPLSFLLSPSFYDSGTTLQQASYNP